MTSAFLFRDPDPAAAGEPANGRPLFGGGDFDRHVTRWNDNCVFCHNVAPNPARDPETGRFATTVAELGIACEACHGPGAEHVARNADPARRARLAATGAADPTIVNPSRLSPGRAADLCGRCHGQRLADDVGPFLAHGDPFVPGDDLAIESAPLWRDTPLHGDRTAFAARFWTDGTARLTAYEYQGLLQSPCAMRGPLTCTSCHGMHEGDPRGQLRARFAPQADAMCTGCHQALAAAPRWRRTRTTTRPGRAPAACACHMPRIVYGVLDVHRSHRIEVPDPARAAAAGRPDACTGCHVDRTAAWAQARLRRFWGSRPVPGRRTGPGGDGAGRGDPGRRSARAADRRRRDRRVPHNRLTAPTRNGRLGLLLEVMENDAVPSGPGNRLARPRAAWPPGEPTAELLRRSAYDPAAPAEARARVGDRAPAGARWGDHPGAAPVHGAARRRCRPRPRDRRVTPVRGTPHGEIV